MSQMYLYFLIIVEMENAEVAITTNSMQTSPTHKTQKPISRLPGVYQSQFQISVINKL
jgi:hypothetical protein